MSAAATACLLLSSEWPPDCLGGLGRYVAEVAPRLAADLPLRVALVPTYQDLGGALFAPGGPRRACDWGAYREALAAFRPERPGGALAAAARVVAGDCAADIGRGATVFVQDYFLAPLAQALRDLGVARRIVAMCHLPVHAGFTYFDKPAAEQTHQILEAQLVRIADAVIAPSRFAADALHLVHNLPHRKRAVIPLGVHRPLPLRPLPPGPLRVAFVGRPNEQKGQHFLFMALARWRRRCPDARVTVAGGAGDDCRVRALAVAHGVADAVDFAPGFDQDGIWPFIDAHHCLVTTSVYETFGLAVLEAMASGRATIGFPTGSLPELWGEHLTPLFATGCADVDALATQLETLAGDRARIADYGGMARTRAAQFDWASHTAALLPLLAEPGRWA